ncbi:helix-turn-helix domain-containing protein [Promicromonospora soli]
MRTAEDAALVQSVDRAAHILELLSDAGPMGVSDVSRHLGVHRSTAFRLLATLEGRHLVEQETHRGLYRLGLGLLRLAGGVSHRSIWSGTRRPAATRWPNGWTRRPTRPSSTATRRSTSPSRSAASSSP